ncbi:DNA helicase [Luteimicrobium album]|uniref:DNA 3'-5' helicase n=1 Tax=Luteimicrobium album TaxID=1054550 RepID=A0ABQ6HWU1_9MICO|nr:DNA helicase [Luteimicrobium album]
MHEGGQLLIVAGAGSGKTRVLTHRIAYALATGRATPGEVLAITFTNKAAAEMRERVAALVGPVARRMWVSTFHSACVRILRAEHDQLGLKSTFSIYDAADSQRLVTLVCRELDLDVKKYPPRSLANKISDLKNELVDPETYRTTSGASSESANAFDGVLADVYVRYQQRLQQAHALDFDDLIMTTVNLLQAFPAVAEHYRRRFRHILVDEYQDTNHAQYVLVRELAGVGAEETEAVEGDDREQHHVAPVPPAELTVVGDADQSIYAFRGATIRNILEFEADYPNARTILLEQNYRSTQTILSAANAVIARNPDRKPKRLWTDSGAGTKIIGYVADNEHEEARFVAEEIDRLGDSDGVRPGDVAVFYRTNAQSRALEEVLIRVGLPYKVVGGTRFYERREIKDAIAYLRAVDNLDDDVNLRRVLGVPKRGIGERSEALVASFAERERISFGAALGRLDEIPAMTTRTLRPLEGFRDLMAGLRELAATGVGPAEVLGAVLDRSGMLAELRDSDDPQDASRVENLAELHAVAVEFEQDEPDGTLADFLERVSLVADSDQIPAGDGADDGETRDPGVITLMTLHTAKGLEFPVVFLTGLEDGTFPHMRSLHDDGELAEERRLAYVGITRARERLYMSRSAVRSAWGWPTSSRRPGSSTRSRRSSSTGGARSRRCRRCAPAGRCTGRVRRGLGRGPGGTTTDLPSAALVPRAAPARPATIRRRPPGPRRLRVADTSRWVRRGQRALVEPLGRTGGAGAVVRVRHASGRREHPFARRRGQGHARRVRARDRRRARGFRAERGRQDRLRRRRDQAAAAAVLARHQAVRERLGTRCRAAAVTPLGTSKAVPCTAP